MMKYLLIKPEKTGVFCYTKRVDNEPLELEYLYTILKSMGHEAFIYDRRYNMKSLKAMLKLHTPDVVCITCYINQENLAKIIILKIKAYMPTVKIIIGGSHVELNYQNFFDTNADYLYHISGLESFKDLTDYLACVENAKALNDISGICYRNGSEWITTQKTKCTPNVCP